MNTRKPAPSHGLGLWVAILGLSTFVSITLNLWHALAAKADPKLIQDACAVSTDLCEYATKIAAKVVGLHPVLGIIFAIVPPVFAALLSHGLITPMVGEWIKRAILGLFAVSMATSVVSQAAVMRPYGGGYYAEWAIPLVLDASALIALHVITRSAALNHASAREAEERATLRPIIAEELRDQFQQEQATREARLREELERNKNAELAELRRELTGNHSTELTELRRELGENHSTEIARLQECHSEELTAREQKLREEFTNLWQKAEGEIRRQAQAETKSLVRDAEIATEARVRLELTQNGTPSKRTPKAIGRGPKNDGGPQVNKRDRAASILRTNPDIEAKDLAGMLDCTPKYARDLIKDLVPGRGNGQDETGGEEVRLHAVP